ncbi:hypothetical protein [Myceligenerans indicum]|uniref:Integral membrane protein n=1 Tax=Myceligenerans indicum TaxID=2593663 RepID=A0ABS1LME2_9MICO|nr:hypothetical protein [Myceligenerans indicum]MBL0886727.1 hypothetical protein [Myceligenerans indicum]
MSTDLMAWVAVALFLGATTWTAARARTWSDAPLPLGLACVTVASTLRAPVVVGALRTVTGSPVDEVAKHVMLVVGCILVQAWVAQTLAGKTPRIRHLSGASTGTALLMVTTFLLSGPWVAADLDAQTQGKPLMVVYWAVFYGSFVCATSLFAYSALRSRSRRTWRLRWGMDLAAAGAGTAVAWAAVSFLSLLHQLLGTDQPQLVPGIQTRYLIIASSVLVTVGIIGHLASAAIVAHRHRPDLAYLHQYVTTAVSATVPPPMRDGAVNSYHRTIQVLDGIGVLAHYSTPADRAEVRARIPTCAPEVLIAHDLRMSRERLENGEARSSQPADWARTLADDFALRRLGRALRAISDGSAVVHHSTDGSPDGSRAEPRWARAVTEVFAPGYTVAGVVLTIGLLSARLPEAWWQVPLLVLLAAGLPYVFIHALARLGIWESRHVRPRAQRVVALAGLLVIEAGALFVMTIVDAPPLMLRLLAACLTGVLALALVTPVVRASIHVGVFSVTAGIAATEAWPLAAALVALGMLVGAARLAVREHTPIEVVAALVVGFSAGLAAARLLAS